MKKPTKRELMRQSAQKAAAKKKAMLKAQPPITKRDLRTVCKRCRTEEQAFFRSALEGESIVLGRVVAVLRLYESYLRMLMDYSAKKRYLDESRKESKHESSNRIGKAR